MLECNIDDMNGELFSHVMEKLFTLGVNDVTYSSIYMKKNRPATQISVLVSEQLVEEVEKFLLIETTTFGIRKYAVERRVLSREFVKKQTDFGNVTFKLGVLDHKLIKVTPEYESLKKLSDDSGEPLRVLYEKAQVYINNNFQVKGD